MTTKQKKLVKSSWLKVLHLSERKVADIFFERLHDIAPEMGIASSLPVDERSRKLIFDLTCLVDNMYAPGQVHMLISPMAQLYEGFKLSRYQYAIFGNALMWMLECMLKTSWNQEVEEAWASFWIEVSESMIAAQLPQRIRA